MRYASKCVAATAQVQKWCSPIACLLVYGSQKLASLQVKTTVVTLSHWIYMYSVPTRTDAQILFTHPVPTRISPISLVRSAHWTTSPWCYVQPKKASAFLGHFKACCLHITCPASVETMSTIFECGLRIVLTHQAIIASEGILLASMLLLYFWFEHCLQPARWILPFSSVWTVLLFR